MNIKTEAAQLTRALGYSEFGLADMLHELGKAQKERVSEFVRKHGYLDGMRALWVNPAELEQLMLDTGHVQCDECEEWFPADDVIVTDPEPPSLDCAEGDEIPESVIRCAGCNEEYS